MRAAQHFRSRPGKACFSLKTQALALDSPSSCTDPPVRSFLAALCFLATRLRDQIAPGGNRGLPAILFLPATARIVGT